MSEARLTVDVWSDLVCPWCYIGKRRLEGALAGFAHREHVDVVHRAFQLHPDLPPGQTIERRGMLKAKYRLSDDQVATMDECLERLAAEDGLDYDLSGGVTGNTVNAHRLSLLAREGGQQDAVVERLFRAYFTEQRSIFDVDGLVALGAEAGLDATTVRAMLDSRQLVDAVQAEHEQASALGARGVPFFVLGGRYSVSGAQQVEVFRDALERAWADPAALTA
jgi:predicted DsbA family dithiol-disulfide isomerase